MPKMKDSGIRWIGDIPKTYSLTKIKNMYSVTLGKMIAPNQEDNSQTLENYLSAANIKWDGVHTEPHKTMWFSPSEKTEYLLKDGDLVMMEGGSAGTACLYRGELAPCYMQNSVNRCRGINGNLNGYLYYWLYIAYYQGYIDSICNKATIQHFTKDKVKQTPIINFSVEIQKKITEYLNAKCSNIDAVISEAKASIEDYKALKQSIITRAITKGLDPNAEMKDSGIEWTKQVPMHWDCVIGKYLFCETNEKSVDGHEELLSVSHITGVTPRSQKNVNMFMATSLEGYKICHINDIAANTMWMWQGAIGVSKYDGVISPSYNTYRQINNRYDPDYLDYLLRIRPLIDAYNAHSTGITKSRLRLYPEQFLAIKYIVPPRDEQIAIVKYLDDRCSTIHALIKQKEDTISDLEAYKKALIYEVVTGKRSVV